MKCNTLINFSFFSLIFHINQVAWSLSKEFGRLSYLSESQALHNSKKINSLDLYEEMLSQCEIKRCTSETNIQLQENQCIWSHTNNETVYFEFQPSNCKENERCIFTSEENRNISCTPKQKERGVHKDYCEKNSDCYSDICSGTTCIGKPALTQCMSSEECKINYYCGYEANNTEHLKCIPQKKVNETCTDDVQCENDKGCYKLNNSSNGICKEYLSLPDGSLVSETQTIFCSSHFAHNGKCITTNAKSEEMCKLGQTHCDYTYMLENKEYSLKLPCQCSDTYSNSLFCPMGVTNPLFKTFIKDLGIYYSCKAFKKHSTRRHLLDLELNILKLKTVNFPKLKDASRCYSEYVAKAGFLSFTSLAILLFFTFIFLQ